MDHSRSVRVQQKTSCTSECTNASFSLREGRLDELGRGSAEDMHLARLDIYALEETPSGLRVVESAYLREK